MSLNDQDYYKLAQAIVTDFVTCNVPLQEGLVKVAGDHGLNVHETRRLLETTNVQAHLHLFKEASDHKYVEFDVIDPDAVCQRLFGRVDTPQDCSPEKLASQLVDDEFDLPNEHRAAHAVPGRTKSAATKKRRKFRPEKYAGDRGYYTVARLNKVASELENRILEMDIEYRELTEKIAEEYRSIYSDDVALLEKEAYTLFGSAAGPVLYAVKDCLGVDTRPTNVKHAGAVIRKPVHEKVASAIALYNSLKAHVDGYKWYKREAGKLMYG